MFQFFGRYYKRVAIVTLLLTCLLIGLALLNLERLMYQLVVRERPIAADAIVILLGGAANERVDQAASLYEQHFAPRIVLCDGYQISGFKSWWYGKSGWIPLGKTFRYHLKMRGIPESAISLAHCPDIHDTASEVQALTEHLNANHIQSVLLSTSASHSRRASIVWKRITPSIPATMVAARDPGLYRWWTTRRGRTTVIYEYLALTKELIRQHVDFRKNDSYT